MPAPSIEPARPATLRLAFSPDQESAREVSVAIRRFLADQGVAEKELFSFELCMAEASSNAVEYAEGPFRDLKPIAEALLTPSQVELRVTDHTAGFTLREHIPQPSPLKDRGRGLFLIQSVMDEVRYLRGTNENILVMRKKRNTKRVPAENQGEAADDPPSLEECMTQLAEAKGQLAKVADELQLRSEMLASVFRCCSELGGLEGAGGSGGYDGFEGRILIDLLHLTSADWYVLRMLSPDGRSLQVEAASESDLNSGPVALKPDPGAPAGIEATVALSQKASRFDNSEGSNPAEPLLAVGPKGTGHVCPLSFGGTLVGTIAVGRRSGDFPLGRLQDDVIRTFAEFLAIQTLNMRRQREDVRNLVVTRELEIAQDIQQLLLPRTLPQLFGFGLVGGWWSAREVGGDFYDAIALGDKSLLLMIADVMGKGVPAALFATTMRGLLRGLAAHDSDPAKLLSGLNRLLYNELSSASMFITAQIVHVDLVTRKLTAASAGHCPPLFVLPGLRSVSSMPIQGLPLGVLPDTVYPQMTDTMGTPAALLLYTDGLTDMRNEAGETFGPSRLRAWLRINAIPGRTALEMRDRLATDLTRFRGASVMDDDQAFLLLTEERGGPLSAGNHPSRRRGDLIVPSGAIGHEVPL